MSKIMHEIEHSETLIAIKQPKQQPYKIVGRQIRFWIPIIIVALLATLGDYIARDYRHLTVGAIDYLTQILAYLIVVLFLYRALVVLTTISSKRQRAEDILALQSEELTKARTALINTTEDQVNADVKELDALAKDLPRGSLADETLEEGIKRLKQIVDTFQFVVSIESGKLMEEANNGDYVQANDILQSSLSILNKQIESKQIKVETIGNSNVLLPGNIRMTTQVIGSILHNAVQFSPKGTAIRLEIEELPKFTSLTITDQGIGIPSDEIYHLFQPFTRTDHSDALVLDHDGLGIDLYLDKIIMDKIGGNIEVRTSPGRGTSFILYWPKAIEKPQISHFSLNDIKHTA